LGTENNPEIQINEFVICEFSTNTVHKQKTWELGDRNMHRPI